MSRPRLLDPFCGAGGASRGYQLAGFYVVGVDIAPQPRYAGDEFIQADALSFPLDGFDAYAARADARALEQETRAHRLECVSCTTKDGRLAACETLRGMRAELREQRAAIRHWFDPSPDQGTLL